MTIYTSMTGPAAGKPVSTGQDIADVLNALGGGKKVSMIAGVIRNTGSGWELITDSSHDNISIDPVDSVTNDASKIVVNYAGIGATKVLSFTIVPDETYAGLGYVAGASVGKTFANISVSRVANNRAAALFDYNAGNVTVPYNQEYGIESVSYDAANKFFAVTHQDYGSYHWTYTPIICPRRACPPVAKIETATATETKFYFEDNTGVKVEPPNGAQFTFTRGADFIHQNVDPNTLTEAVGNFWFIGVFEVG